MLHLKCVVVASHIALSANKIPYGNQQSYPSIDLIAAFNQTFVKDHLRGFHSRSVFPPRTIILNSHTVRSLLFSLIVSNHPMHFPKLYIGMFL